MKKITELLWGSHFTENLAGDLEEKNFTRPVSHAFFSRVIPTPVKAPKLLGWSRSLANELGIAFPTAGSDDHSISVLGGNLVLPGMTPYAARYGGHQFGNWAGQLGDGRAITLGDAPTHLGREEFQLKGSGPTPYSRRADGRAVLRSSVREFLCSEAMHHLGIPTTRALSLVGTGDLVTRDLFYDGNPKDEPGAIVCRVSPSFLRFGSFEILASEGETAELKTLADFLIREHFPEIESAEPDAYGKLLDEIARRTAVTLAHWMRVGFVHGVMNTDNLSVLGLTIDYGPYGWLEGYDPGWTPNTTDRERKRYRYGSQPSVAQWNLARLCESFISLIPDESRLTQTMKIYEETFLTSYGEMIAAKLGLPEIGDGDEKLVGDVFKLLAAEETDFTLFFRELSSLALDGRELSLIQADFLTGLRKAFFNPENASPQLLNEWSEWCGLYAEAVKNKGMRDRERHVSMKKSNPKIVLRNYLAQNAITALESGDDSVLRRLSLALETPYDDQEENLDFAEKRPEWARNKPGCSALSCSS